MIPSAWQPGHQVALRLGAMLGTIIGLLIGFIWSRNSGACRAAGSCLVFAREERLQIRGDGALAAPDSVPNRSFRMLALPTSDSEEARRIDRPDLLVCNRTVQQHVWTSRLSPSSIYQPDQRYSCDFGVPV